MNTYYHFMLRVLDCVVVTLVPIILILATLMISFVGWELFNDRKNRNHLR